MSDLDPSPRGAWFRISLLLLLGVLLLALGSRIVPAMAARMTTPTGGAEWIWMDRSRTDLSPAAFYAVRDFFLDAAPARARLLILADPEYVLTLNGKRIGAGRYQQKYQPGEPARLDVYELGDLLVAGGNRLLVELRSDRGAGGLLAALQDGAGRTLVCTDGDWRIVQRHNFGLIRGLVPLGPDDDMDSLPVFSWGPPPTGRWGRPEVGPVLPRLADLMRGTPAAASRLPSAPIPGLPATSAQYVALFDWGREVTGYLSLQMPPGDGLKKALLFTGEQPPDPLRDRPAGAVLTVNGRRSWMDAQARRFRYALVIGDRPAGAVTARIFPVDPKLAAGRVIASVAGGGRKIEGVFGLEPPPLRTPLQDEIWRQLQRVPRVGRRKDR
jgi:hypothetical protein